MILLNVLDRNVTFSTKIIHKYYTYIANESTKLCQIFLRKYITLCNKRRYDCIIQNFC